MPERKVSSAKEAVKEEHKRRSARFLANLAPATVEMKPKEAAGKDKYSDRRVQTKGSKRLKWPTETLKIYLQEIEKLKMRRYTSDEAGEKEVKSD